MKFVQKSLWVFSMVGGVSISLVAAPSAIPEGSKITVDGSSTVYPISAAVAEKAASDPLLKMLRVSVSYSGTGGGFKKFCRGEIEMTGASRPIKASEMEICSNSKIEFIELPVAYDALAVVAHKDNVCAENMTPEQLKRIWEPAAEKKITNWNQVPGCSMNLPLRLYGPGTDSGTFDYFTEAIVGATGKSRADYTASEDDNVLVMGVSGDKGALGYFGLAYYLANQTKVKTVKINGVLPSIANVANGTYLPLSRPLFLYVSKSALKRPEVERFSKFYVENAGVLAPEVGYASLGGSLTETTRIYGLVQSVLNKQVTGTSFSHVDHSKVLKLEEALQKKM